MQTVKLNVGGQIFECHPQTLMGSNRLSIMHRKNDDDLIFIDRDPQLFQLILGYLRTGKLCIDQIPPHLIDAIQTEAEYYEMYTCNFNIPHIYDKHDICYRPQLLQLILNQKRIAVGRITLQNQVKVWLKWFAKYLLSIFLWKPALKAIKRFNWFRSLLISSNLRPSSIIARNLLLCRELLRLASRR
jgi:hypothetical protein